MQIQTKGIILKQSQIPGERRILMIFSEKFGKISAFGTESVSRGKSKSSLAYRPFTLGQYDLYKGRDDIYNINKAETIKTFYKIGEDVEKYMCASYALEFLSKILTENQQSPKLFQLLLDFLEILEARNKDYIFLLRVFQIKTIQYSGVLPELNHCVSCGSIDGDFTFSVSDGGLICKKCVKDDGLIYDIGSDIISELKYIAGGSFVNFAKLSLDQISLEKLGVLISQYISYHLGIQDLKSESYLDAKF